MLKLLKDRPADTKYPARRGSVENNVSKYLPRDRYTRPRESSALDDHSEFLQGSRLNLHEDRSIKIMQTNNVQVNTNSDLRDIEGTSQSTANLAPPTRNENLLNEYIDVEDRLAKSFIHTDLLDSERKSYILKDAGISPPPFV